MKKIIIGILGLWLTFGLFSCEESSVEDAFDVSTEQRVDDEIEKVRNALRASEFGWTAYFLFNNDNNDSYFNIRFLNEGNRAEISYVKDKQVYSAECNYTLRYGQHLELIFDTYSPLAELTNNADNGDFRFTLKEYDSEHFSFSTFKDTQDRAGVLNLNKSTSLETFDRLQAMRNRVVNDLNRSFYRLIQLDGSVQKYVFRYQVDAVVDWMEGGKLQTWSAPVEVTETGFKLKNPLSLEGKNIDNFVYNAADSNFFVMEGNKQVGILDYTLKKPFVYPNAVQMFMDEIGADTSSIMIAPIGFSPKMHKKYQLFLESDPTFLQMVIEPCKDLLAFGSTKGYNFTAFYRIDTEYKEDAMCFIWTGTASDNGYSINYYRNGGYHIMDELLTDIQAIQPPGGSIANKRFFSIVPRGSYYYFVRDDDPTISFVGKPQFRDDF